MHTHLHTKPSSAHTHVRTYIPIFECFLLFEVFEGIVLYGMYEGLWDRMDREFGQYFYQHQAEDKVNGEFLSFSQIVLLSPVGWEGGVSRVSVGRGREGGRHLKVNISDPHNIWKSLGFHLKTKGYTMLDMQCQQH